MLKKIIARSLEKLGGLALARFITRRHPTILMYHRIIHQPMVAGIHPELFEQQLIYLKKYFHVINMKEYIAALHAQQVPNNCVVLTFDDGHKDFYTTAWPLLKKYQLTASLYIATGFVDQQCWLWPDLLRYVLITTTHSQLQHPTLGTLPLDDSRMLATWNSLGDYCLTLKTEMRLSFILQLAHSLDVQIPQAPVEPFAAVSWENLREMQQEGLDIGSHSVSHPILSTLNPIRLEQELADSKQRIEQELEISPQGICYPNGMAKDTSIAVEFAAQHYYNYGLVAYPAKDSKRNLMHLGRMAAANDFEEFKVRINHLSHGNNHKGEYR